MTDQTIKTERTVLKQRDETCAHCGEPKHYEYWGNPTWGWVQHPDHNCIKLLAAKVKTLETQLAAADSAEAAEPPRRMAGNERWAQHPPEPSGLIVRCSSCKGTSIYKRIGDSEVEFIHHCHPKNCHTCGHIHEPGYQPPSPPPPIGDPTFDKAGQARALAQAGDTTKGGENALPK